MNKRTPDITRVDVVIIGGGFAGMYATYKFREAGKVVLSIEAGGDVGGVWYWNRYPGARCDMMSLDYSYGFSDEIQQEWTWTEQFAGQKEILNYAHFVADKLDLRKHYRFNTRVTAASWNDAEKQWYVRTDTGKIVVAPYAIMATGPLSVPKDPDIPGIERFKGQLIRAQRWPHEAVSFAGKRVGVIGTGSTGIQIVQTIGELAGELYVFQRTPSFTLPMRNQKLTPSYVEEMKRHYRTMRNAMKNNPSGGSRPSTHRPYFSVTPAQRRQLLEQGWKNGGYDFRGMFGDLMTNREANELVADFVREKIGQVVNDAETADALKPRNYPIFARRICLDTQYYETYNLPNVHLKNCLHDPIIEITENGIRTESGETELDIIIFATGYDGLTGALLAFDVTGRDGRKLKEKWRDGSCSFLGFMIEGFPNLFAPSGPNGPAALANLIATAEHDVDWAADVINYMEDSGISTVEPSVLAEAEWMSTVLKLADTSLISEAKTWWVGSNVKGKPTGLRMFVGGFANYKKYCQEEANRGYPGLIFDMVGSSADSSTHEASRDIEA